MEHQGQPGQDQKHQGQKPQQPGKREEEHSPQPGKDKGIPPRNPDNTGGRGGGSQNPR